MVVTETNRYAEMKRAARVIKCFLHSCVENRGAKRSAAFKFPYLCPWTPIFKEDIHKFIAILCLSSAHDRVSNISEWWSKDSLREFSALKSIMPKDQFLSILKYLHLANPYRQLQAGGDKIFKVRDFMNALNGIFQKRYQPGRHLTVDEMMIKFKGRLGIVQFMPRKPVKRGITGLGESVVMHLLEPYQHLGHTVTMDRYFTGVSLFKSLPDVSVYATGTIQSSRGSARGTTKWVMKGQLVASKSRVAFPLQDSSHSPKFLDVACWQDKAPVFFLSTFATPTSEQQEYSSRRVGGNRVQVPAPPPVVKHYNATTKGVDLSDQLRASHPITIPRLKRWWLQLFFWLLTTLIENSRILLLECSNDPRWKSTYEFRVALVRDLLNGVVPRTAAIGKSHFQEPLGVKGLKRRPRLRCRVCGKKTSYKCSSCKIPLCLVGCFKAAHEK